MSIKNFTLGLVFGAAIYLGMGFSAANAAVFRCDNCSEASKRSLAQRAGAGTHLVADFGQKTVMGWNVEYDRERRVWMVLTAMIPQEIRNSFAYDLSPAMANSGGVIFVGPNRPNNPFPFPQGFEGANAYDIVGSATLRGLLEQQVASRYSGATSSNSTWNDIAFSLKSLALSFLGQTIGADSATIVIVWSDGSRTTLRVESGATHEATYQEGRSRDSQGHKIPDPAVSNPDTGGRYAGSYGFNTWDGRQEWVNAGGTFGVQFVGGGSSGRAMTCTWDGRTLTCRLYSY